MGLFYSDPAEWEDETVETAGDYSRFSDAAKVSAFAKEGMQWAVGNSIITGKENGTAIVPQGNASRAEYATIIMRFMKIYEE